mmetsp:Transcript_106339/g.297697  ORF Transcript_106339/g.297697 Transcript_106339/m.297697 type:complete len:137 (+) Transcript_106339:197-607(+)
MLPKNVLTSSRSPCMVATSSARKSNVKRIAPQTTATPARMCTACASIPQEFVGLRSEPCSPLAVAFPAFQFAHGFLQLAVHIDVHDLLLLKLSLADCKLLLCFSKTRPILLLGLLMRRTRSSQLVNLGMPNLQLSL